MGLFDKIKKSVSETVSDASTHAEVVFANAKSQVAEAGKKVGESASNIASATIKCVGDELSYMGDAISEASDGDYSKLKGMATATSDFLAETAKDMTGINAYNHYQAAKTSREEAEKIAHRVEEEVGKIRYLANDRLKYMGEIRMQALKNTVGRFISIVKRLNQGVRDKEYEMYSQIDISEGELEEMKMVSIDQKEMTSTIVTGIGAASAASVGAQKLAIYGVQKLATASTGTAIKNLSGAAAEKATMAWLLERHDWQWLVRLQVA